MWRPVRCFTALGGLTIWVFFHFIFAIVSNMIHSVMRFVLGIRRWLVSTTRIRHTIFNTNHTADSRYGMTHNPQNHIPRKTRLWSTPSVINTPGISRSQTPVGVDLCCLRCTDVISRDISPKQNTKYPHISQSVPYLLCDRRGESIQITQVPYFIISCHLYWLLPEASMAIGYCRCLLLSIRPGANHLLVHAITRDPFKLGSPNSNHKCKKPWLRSLLFYGVIDIYLQGHIYLRSQNYPILS